MDIIFSYILIIIFLFVAARYLNTQIKKLGFMFSVVIAFKWLIGVLVTFFAFYILYLAGDFMKENDLSVVFGLPVGIAAWFIPMHYISKVFESLEEKYKKEESQNN